MHFFSMACSLILAVSFLELLSACGLEENGQRHRQIVYVTRNQADVTAHAGENFEIPNQSQEGQSPLQNDPGSEESSQESVLAAMPVKLGIRDFHQINQTMAYLTGVPSTTPAVKAIYDSELRTQLPISNDIKGFLASHQVGISKLATEYCDALMANPNLRGTVLAGFNFNQAPAAALSDAQANTVSQALLSRFWGPELSTQPDRSAAVASLKELLVELRTTAVANTPAETLNILKGACTATLASSSVTTF